MRSELFVAAAGEAKEALHGQSGNQACSTLCTQNLGRGATLSAVSSGDAAHKIFQRRMISFFNSWALGEIVFFFIFDQGSSQTSMAGVRSSRKRP